MCFTYKLNSQLFWDVTPYQLVNFSRLLEKFSASISRVKSPRKVEYEDISFLWTKYLQLAQWLGAGWRMRGFDFREQIFPNCSDNGIKHLTLLPIWPSSCSKPNTTFQNLDIVRNQDKQWVGTPYVESGRQSWSQSLDLAINHTFSIWNNTAISQRFASEDGNRFSLQNLALCSG